MMHLSYGSEQIVQILVLKNAGVTGLLRNEVMYMAVLITIV